MCFTKNQKSSSNQVSNSNSASNSQSDSNSMALSGNQTDSSALSGSDSASNSATNSGADSLSNSATNSALTTMGNDPALMQAYHTLLQGGLGVASNPLQLYNGPLVAGLTPDQQSAISAIGQSGGLATPFLTEAGQLARDSTSPLSVTPFNASTLAQYYSPYQSNVIDSTRKLLNLQDAEQQNNLAGNAMAAGAWGGDRSAVLQSTLARNQDLANNKTLADLQDQGFRTAMGQFNTQNQLGLQAGQYNNQNKQAAGYELGTIGEGLQNSALTSAQALLGAGGLEQQIAQQNLNVPYEQYLQQEAYPYQNLNFLSSLLPGILQGTGQTTVGSNLGSTFGSNTGFTTGNSTGSNNGYSLGSNSGTSFGVNSGSATGSNNASSSSVGTGVNTQPGPSGLSQVLGLASMAIPFLQDGGRVSRASGGGGLVPAPMSVGHPDFLDYGQSYVPAASPPPGNPAPYSPGAGTLPNPSNEFGAAPPALMQTPASYAPPAFSGGGLGMAAAAPTSAPALMQAPNVALPNLNPVSPSSAGSGGAGGAGGTDNGLQSAISGLGTAINDKWGPLAPVNVTPINPQFDQLAPVNVTPENSMFAGSGGGGFFDSIGSGLSSAASGIGDFLGSLKTGGRAKLADGGADDDGDFNSILDNLYPTPPAPKSDGAMSLADTPPAWRGQVTNYGDSEDSQMGGMSLSNSPAWDDGTPVARTDADSSNQPWTPHDAKIMPQIYQPKPDWRRAMLTAGAAMMAGTSPFALTNIGKGAQAGLADYYGQQDKDNHPEVDHSGPTSVIRYADGTLVDTGIPTEAALNAKANNDYRIANSQTLSADRKAAIQERADAARQMAADRAQAEKDRVQAEKDRLDYQRQTLADRADARSQGRYTWQPGTQVGEDGKPVSGMWRLPTRGDEQPTFMPGDGIVSRAQPKPPVSMTPATAFAQARKDYDNFAKQDKANGGAGTVYNSDGSVAQSERWITSQAGKYLNGAAAQRQAAPQNRATPPTAKAPAPISVAPSRPVNVPPGAKFSPSQKNWWWQANGQWAHS